MKNFISANNNKNIMIKKHNSQYSIVNEFISIYFEFRLVHKEINRKRRYLRLAYDGKVQTMFHLYSKCLKDIKAYRNTYGAYYLW